jgi:hypothetical protein
MAPEGIQAAGIIVENAAYWYETDNLEEAQYLCAMLNSGIIDTRLASLRSRMQAAHPHVHKKIFDVAPIPRFASSDTDHQALTRLTQICTAKVQAWKVSGETGESKDIGVMRRKARAIIASELTQIDLHVEKILA